MTQIELLQRQHITEWRITAGKQPIVFQRYAAKHGANIWQLFDAFENVIFDQQRHTSSVGTLSRLGITRILDQLDRIL